MTLRRLLLIALAASASASHQTTPHLAVSRLRGGAGASSARARSWRTSGPARGNFPSSLTPPIRCRGAGGAHEAAQQASSCPTRRGRRGEVHAAEGGGDRWRRRHLLVLLSSSRCSRRMVQARLRRRVLQVHVPRPRDGAAHQRGGRARRPPLVRAVGAQDPAPRHLQQWRLADARDGVVERGAALRLVPDAGARQVVQDGAGDGGRHRPRRQALLARRSTCRWR